MKSPYQYWLDRWSQAGLLDAAATKRIAEFEEQNAGREGLPWPVWAALGFGGIMLAAGTLLFVGAHWDEITPGGRLALVLLLVTIFHAGGASVTVSFPALGSTFHALGTVALGAGIFLTGQIYHLEENWPQGFLLWALGAWCGWWLLRDWVQGAIAAVLTPAWLVAEWTGIYRGPTRMEQGILLIGIALLGLAYLAARRSEADSNLRTSLVFIGASIVSVSIPVMILAAREPAMETRFFVGNLRLAVGWAFALGGPLITGWLLRGRQAWPLVAWAGWLVLLGRLIAPEGGLPVYFWCALGALGMVGWGSVESSPLRINLGTIGFAATVAVFYFSNVMDILGRAFGLIGLGLLFLLGGWALEKTRRRLIAIISRQPG